MIAMNADEDMTAHDFRPAVDDICNCLPMTRQDGLIESFPVRSPVSPKNIRDAGHDPLEISQKAIESFVEGLETLIGQVGIDSGGLRTFMSQQFLNHSQINPSFE